MKEYIKFLSKRVFLRKANIALILFILAIVLAILILNMRTQRLYDSMYLQIETIKANIEKDTEALSSMAKDNENYILNQATIERNKLFLETKEEMLNLFKKNDFLPFYKLYKTELEESIQIFINAINPEDISNKHINEIAATDYKQLAYINYLNEHQLAYEDIEFPIFGLSFMVFMSDYILPILILICVIYILAQAFTLDYAKDIDISNLFPIGRRKVFISKMMTGIGASTFIFLLSTLSAFAFASLINQNMGLSYPLITTDIDKNFIAISLISNLMKWMSLGFLFFVSVACFMYLLALWIKEDTALFLTGITIVLGVAFMPKFIQALNPIAHLLPTTYMNYVSVVQGNIAVQYDNINITFHQGILVLLLFIGLSMLTAYILRTKTFKIHS